MKVLNYQKAKVKDNGIDDQVVEIDVYQSPASKNTKTLCGDRVAEDLNEVNEIVKDTPVQLNTNDTGERVDLSSKDAEVEGVKTGQAIIEEEVSSNVNVSQVQSAEKKTKPTDLKQKEIDEGIKIN